MKNYWRIKGMPKRDDLLTQMARAVLSICDNESDVLQVIDLLHRDDKRSDFLHLLADLGRVRMSAEGGPVIQPRRTRDSRTRNTVDSGLEGIARILRNRGITPATIQNLVRRKYGANVPVNKEGLTRYLRRLARYRFFNDLLINLKTLESDKEVRRVRDEWFEQMHTELKKRESSDKKE